MSGTYAYTASDKLTCEYMSGIIPVILGAVPTVLLKYMMRFLNLFYTKKSPATWQLQIITLQKNFINLGRHIFIMFH